MSAALPLVRFRLQTADGSRWWRAQCDWTQPAENVLRLSVERVVYTMRRSLGLVAADRLRDPNRLPRVTLPRGRSRAVIEVAS